MSDIPKYLSGTRSPYDAHWSKRATRGDVLAEEHRKANPDPTPWQERYKWGILAAFILCICVPLVVLIAGKVVANTAIDRINFEVVGRG